MNGIEVMEPGMGTGPGFRRDGSTRPGIPGSGLGPGSGPGPGLSSGFRDLLNYAQFSAYSRTNI